MASEENEFVGDSEKIPTSVSVSMNMSSNVAHTSTPTSEAPLTVPSNLSPVVSSKPPTSKKRTHKLTSDVWNHFEPQVVDGKKVAVCNYCKIALKGGGHSGTTSLKNHINSCSTKATMNIETCFAKQKQLCLERKPLDGNVRFGNFTFKQEESRKDLAAAIIFHEYPLSIVDHALFRKFVSGIQPLFTMVSRNTIKEDIFSLYSSEKAKLMGVFEKLGSRIAITTDMWTSNQNKGYMSITSHFLDESWKLQSRILRFIYVPAPHTSEVLANELINALTAWNIETKVSTITVDNCTSNDSMIRYIVDKLYSDLILDGKILHMRCCAHILNLVVKDGLNIIKDAIVTIRDSVAFWSASASRVEKFEDVARQSKIKHVKKLVLDCRTRWNSTYLMLHTAIDYKDIFPRLKLRDKNYTNVPSERDWEMAQSIVEKLETFYNATNTFSGTKYPTANTFFVQICELRNQLAEWVSNGDEVISLMAKNMFEKFEKYWSATHIVLAVAVILDPRYKLKVVNFYYPGIYGHMASHEIKQVKQTCLDLLHEYQRRSSTQKSHECTTSSSIQPSDGISGVKQDLSKLVAYLSSDDDTTNVNSELDHYLDEKVMPWTEDFDILNWWKLNGIKYPTLKLIAKDFLAIPISTVASESAFSTSGRVVSNHRSRLKPDTLEALMCTQNWLKGNAKVLVPTMEDLEEEN